MKNSLKAINRVLLVIAILALLFCGTMLALNLINSPQKHEAVLAQISDQTKTINEQAAALEKQHEQQLEECKNLKNDVSSVGTEGEKLQAQLDVLIAENNEKTAQLDQLQADIDFTDHLQERCNELRHQYGLKIRELEDLIVAGESDVKICYWTLDDGPTMWTEQFLDAAAEEGAYLTFFTAHDANKTGDEQEDEAVILRSIMTHGGAICNHTYSHQYAAMGNVYRSIEDFTEVVRQQNDWVLECTGFRTDIFRFPGGSAWARGMKDDCIAALESMDMSWIDWSCNIYDAGVDLPSAVDERINAVWEINHIADHTGVNIAVLLSHDWNTNTLAAMKQAIPILKENGWVFLPLLPESWTIGNTTIIYT